MTLVIDKIDVVEGFDGFGDGEIWGPSILESSFEYYTPHYTPPRYDDIYYAGVEWLDSLACEEEK